VLVTDAIGLVHAFWYLRDGQQEGAGSIYHTVWNGQNWTEPTDVVVIDNGVQGLSPAAGRDHFLHLYWSGERYSEALSSDATSARAWSAPAAVTQGTQHAGIAVDLQGHTHLAYGNLQAAGIYYVALAKDTQPRPQPTLITNVLNAEAAVDWVRIAVGANGTIHVVWTEFQLPNGTPPLGVYYTQSTDAGHSWSDPVKMDGFGYDQINVVTGPNNQVHVVWNGAAMLNGGRFHRWSADGGLTWTARDVIYEHGGGTDGYPQLNFDSAGTLHMVTNSGTSCARHYTWFDGHWSELDCASPERFKVDTTAAAISTGNVLHVLFRELPAHELWYTSRALSAPYVAPLPPPTPVPHPTASPTATRVIADPTALPASLVAALRTPVEPISGPGGPIDAGVLLCAVLLLAFVAFTLLRRRLLSGRP